MATAAADQASKQVIRSKYFPAEISVEKAQAAQSCSEEVISANKWVVRSKYFPVEAAQSCSEDAKHVPQRAQALIPSTDEDASLEEPVVVRSKYFANVDVEKPVVVRSKYFADVDVEKPVVVRSKYFADVDVEKPVVVRSKYFADVDVEKPVVVRSKYFTDVDVEKPVVCSKYFTDADAEYFTDADAEYFTDADVSVEKAKLRVKRPELSNGKRLRKGSKNRIRIKKLKQETNEVSQKPCRLLEPAWDPPVSPYGLIQERLYRDLWKMLIACMLLNRTSGAQMYNVIWDLFALCPTAEDAIAVETEQIEEIIRSLGLQRRRAKMIQRFSYEYLHTDWTDVSQLHGIGKYAADAYKIFYAGRWAEVKPDDYMLKIYWDWLHRTDGIGYGFTPELDA